jgi:hypothetical protein
VKKIMTTRARPALSDCRRALERLKSGETERTWRTDWAAAVALLRAIGNIVHDADSKKLPAIKSAADAAFKRWNSADPQHQIFREFIDSERHAVLERYDFGTQRKSGAILLEEGGRLLTESGDVFVHEQEFFELADGVYKGRDGRKVIQEAIEWWERELTGIETASRVVNAGGIPS